VPQTADLDCHHRPLVAARDVEEEQPRRGGRAGGTPRRLERFECQRCGRLGPRFDATCSERQPAHVQRGELLAGYEVEVELADRLESADVRDERRVGNASLAGEFAAERQQVAQLLGGGAGVHVAQWPPRHRH